MAMRKFVRRFSSASLDIPASGKKDPRDRSVSELVESTESIKINPKSNLEYLGYTYVKDTRSLKEIQTAIRTVKQTSLNRNLWVNLTIKSGMISVHDTTSGETIVMSSIACIAQCVCELNRAWNDCLAITFNSGHNAKQCHVFQAKSAREASELVHQVQKANRTYQKPRNRGQTEISLSLTKPLQMSECPKLGVHLMEDEEGEVIEHKPISRSLSRNESKRMVLRPPSADCNSKLYLDSFGPYGKFPNSSLGFMTTPPKGKRRGGGGGRGVKVRDERAFSRQEKTVQIIAAANKVTEGNAQLTTIASKSTPSSPFEDALYAMHVANGDLLANYIKSGHIHVDACDSSGNSLLHYAVAIGGVEAVRIICQNISSSVIDARGWNECTATHRAVADGNISILRVLLSHNANVNITDLMRRTPLHFSAARREMIECSIALLEAGAQIMATDILGLRPFDLDPELKETQSRLVISACELFSSTAPSVGHTSKHLTTPTSASPMSTRPSSLTSDLTRSIDSAAIRSHYVSHDMSHDFLRPRPPRQQRSPSPATVAEANARVSHWMQTLGRKNKYLKQISRSVSNLSDLREEDEEEAIKSARLEMLKFPSDFNINSTYYVLEDTADDVMRNINDLINVSGQAQLSRATPDENASGEREVVLRRQRSLSEPSLAMEEDVAMETHALISCSSHPQSPLLGSKVTDMRPESVTSQSSADTLGRPCGIYSGESEGDTLKKMSEAFDLLEDELLRNKEVKGRRRELVRMSLPANLIDSRPKEPDSPLLYDMRTVSETEAIFDEILSQIQNDSRCLDDGRVESPDYDRLPPKLPTKPHPHNEFISSRGRGEYVISGGTEERPRKNNDVIDGPGAVVRRLSRRRRDPPFIEEVFGGRSSPLSGGTNKLSQRAPQSRRTSDSDRKSSPIPNILTSSSSDSIPPSAISHMNFDLLHQLSVRSVTPRLSISAGSDDAVAEVTVAELEPAIKALNLMVSVSRNKECLATMVSYLCLPKFMDKLVVVAKSQATPPHALENIATLITNIFEVGGSEGRKTALSSGFLDLIIKLLHTRDPIPGTCLSLLNSLLVNEEDSDHLQKIIRVPSEPLLMYLEPYEMMSNSDADSGIGSRHLSRTTPSGSDNQVNDVNDSSRPNSGVITGANHLEIPLLPVQSSSPSGIKPTAPTNNEMSDSTSVRSLVSPTLKGPSISMIEARTIVLKMLAVSSGHRKMQRGLAKPHSLALLCGCLGDNNQDNVTNATITLANVAQNVDSHELLREAGIVARLRDLLGNGQRQRYHATRGLVYMGELDLGSNNIFTDNDSSLEVDSVVLSTEDGDNGHSYARGATIEKCLEFLTESISHLWGGFSLKSGPRNPGNESITRATKHQITTFFLTCYQSFMHPLIFIRLLLHRLATPCLQNPFDWSLIPEKRGSVPSYSHVDSIPPHQSATLKVIGRWLEDHPDDFLNHPQLIDDISRVVHRLKLARGPYITHSHRLRSLQQDVSRPRSNTLRSRQSFQRQTPHHDNLYTMLKNVVVSGRLPVTMDEAIFLTALQMHIETVAEPSPFIVRLRSNRGNSSSAGALHRIPTKPLKKSFTGRLKSTLPSGYTKSKPLMKRVRAHMTEFEALSERNAKHLFIERCQVLPGYECTLYHVRVPQGARFRKEAKQILGVSSKKVVFLEEKTKELVCSYDLDQVVNVSIEDDGCLLMLTLSEGGSVRFHVETQRTAWDIKNTIQRGTNGQDIEPFEDVVRWSDTIPSSTPSSLPPPSPSHSSSSLSSDDSRETTPPLPPPSTNQTSANETKNGPNHTKPPPLGPIVVPQLSSVVNGHMRWNSFDDQGLGEEETAAGPVPFCDCPPDPEIPRHIKLHQLSVNDVLKCPLECARQTTLIAHEHFGRISSIELLIKVHLIPKNKSPQSSGPLGGGGSSGPPATSKSGAHVEIDTRPQTAVERLAYRFNQVGNWVATTILSFDDIDTRVDAMEKFILIAKHCLDLRNYSTMMAIVMAGLGSAPIRRLHRTWDGVSKIHMEMFKQMDTILESKSNYKNYRDKLSITPVPAVPYIGVFLKDLTFIADGNPDYIRGGLINLHKRRQVYQKLEEINHFQTGCYNYHTVPELQAYLLGFHPVSDEELHSKSHVLEPRIRRSQSHGSGRSKSTSGATGHTSTSSSNHSPANFFKALTRSSSSSSTNLHKLHSVQ